MSEFRRLEREIRVKISTMAPFRRGDLALYLSKNQSEPPSVRFWVNEPVDEVDFWFVLDWPMDWDVSVRVHPSRVFLGIGETCVPDSYYLESRIMGQYMAQFARVISSHPVRHGCADYTFPLLPWMINSNHGRPSGPLANRDFDWLKGLPMPAKSHKVSVFCSSKSDWPGHALRLEFVNRLKKRMGPELDWYGNGIHQVNAKWDGLAPYRYSIVLENQRSNNVVTEKIFDALLAYSFPLYWGAPNISQLVPSNAVIELDIRDLDAAVERVVNVTSSDVWIDRQDDLFAARQLTLEKHNFIKRIEQIAERDFAVRGHLPAKPVVISGPDWSSISRWESLVSRITEKGKRWLGNRGIPS